MVIGRVAFFFFSGADKLYVSRWFAYKHLQFLDDRDWPRKKLCTVCKIYYLSILSYDGASNMRGMYNGLQALVKAKNKHATFVWCHAHRLNLVVKELVSSSVDSVNLFGNLETLYSFIWCAKKRVDLY